MASFERSIIYIFLVSKMLTHSVPLGPQTREKRSQESVRITGGLAFEVSPNEIPQHAKYPFWGRQYSRFQPFQPLNYRKTRSFIANIEFNPIGLTEGATAGYTVILRLEILNPPFHRPNGYPQLLGRFHLGGIL